MSFHERSAWVSLLSTVGIWGAYFWLVFTRPAEQLGLDVSALIGAILLQSLVMIVANSAFALLHRRETHFDERDRAIALRSGLWAGWVLSLGVFACAVLFPMREMALHQDPPGRLAQGALASPFATADILLAWFVLSEVLHYGAQVVLHRRV